MAERGLEQWDRAIHSSSLCEVRATGKSNFWRLIYTEMVIQQCKVLVNFQF